MNKTVKYGLFLLILGIIVGTLLVGVNAVTSPIITKREIAAAEAAVVEIAPKAKELKNITSDYTSRVRSIKTIYQSGDNKYVIYNVKSTGYSGGEILIIVVFDTTTSKIVGTKVTKADKQTAGIGDAIVTHDFQTEGKDASLYANINFKNLDKNQFQVITGATVSSTGFLKGVNIAANHFVKEFGE